MESIFYQRQSILENDLFAYSYGILPDKSINKIRINNIIHRRFRSLIPSYIRDSNVAVIVFDITSRIFPIKYIPSYILDRESFDHVKLWFEDIANQHTKCRVLLLGNKIDLLTARAVQVEEGEQLAHEIHAFYSEISAKTGYNIDSFFEKILSELPANLESSMPSSCMSL